MRKIASQRKESYTDLLLSSIPLKLHSPQPSSQQKSVKKLNESIEGHLERLHLEEDTLLNQMTSKEKRQKEKSVGEKIGHALFRKSQHIKQHTAERVSKLQSE